MDALLTSGCQYLSGVNDLEIVTPNGPDWSCLGRPSTQPRPNTVTYEGAARNLAGNAILQEVTIRFCASSAVSDCGVPLLSVSTTNGIVRFTVDAAFNGYLELESPGMMPGIIELSRAIGEMRELPELRMVDALTMNLFASNMGAEINPSDGHALFWVDDCAGHRAPGVTVNATGGLATDTAQYYVVDKKLPVGSMAETDASGGGGFINIPPNIVAFEARRAATKELISTFSGRIRAGQVTFMMVEPD
jgi:hypothetical protein